MYAITTFSQAFPIDVRDGRVASLQVTIDTSDGSYRPLPYYIPSKGESLSIDFDLLDAVPLNLRYRIEHYNAYWEKSNLFPAEYLRGMSEGIFPDSKPSAATQRNYRHYRLTLDGESDPTPIISGNYEIEIFEENSSIPLLKLGFAVCDPIYSIKANCSPITEEGAYQKNQEISAYIGGSLKTGDKMLLLVAQNGRRDNIVILSNATQSTLNSITFEHGQAALFEAGNEFFSFEILGEHETNMGVMNFFAGKEPMVELFPTKNNSNSSYEILDDANGRVVYRAPYGSSRSDDNADYYWVRFRYFSDPIDSDVILIGEAFEWMPIAEKTLNYNEEEGCYEKTILLKAGYVSYAYATKEASNLSLLKTMGCHYQTKNQYSILCYCRSTGDREYKLVAAQEII